MTGKSTYLFANPSFKEGAGRLLDFADSLTEYNYAPTPAQADAIALALDWYAVGDDLRGAMIRFVDDNPELRKALQARLKGLGSALPSR